LTSFASRHSSGLRRHFLQFLLASTFGAERSPLPRGRAPVLGPQLGAYSSGLEDSLLNLASLDFQRESLTFVGHSV